jgi:cysteine-rich repeat protein
MRSAIVFVVLLVTSAVAGCSGGSNCGNGVIDPGEQCDDGAQNGQPGIACSADCKAISIPHVQLQVVWQMLQQTGVADFAGAHCADVGAASAHVAVSGPASFEETIDCAAASRVYAANCPEADGGQGMIGCGMLLPEGEYQATVTLVRADGSAVTRAVSTAKMMARAGSAITNLVVDFEMPDFLQSYTGALQLRTSWGTDGNTCAQASPAVANESLRLVPAGPNSTGQPVPGMTVHGTTLDGRPGACYTPTNNEPTEKATGIAWGPYNLTLEGFAAGSTTPAYCSTFPIFIGPGQNGQIWSPVVPASPAPTDGGAPDCM